MKREAINHTKMRRLARQLSIEIWGARGLMESIWHVTKEEAPAGDIGKLADEDIADAIGWAADPGALISALVNSGWLDTTPTYRLVVHDWPDHCEDNVHAKLAKARLRFANGSVPKLTKLTGDERKALANADASQFSMPPGVRQPETADPKQVVPVNSPEFSRIPENSKEFPRTSQESYRTEPNRTEPHPTKPAGVREFPAPPGFAAWWAMWTQKTRRSVGEIPAARAWNSCVKPGDEDAVFACTTRYLGSAEVARGAIRNPDRFIFQESENGWKSDWPGARDPPNGSRAPVSSDDDVAMLRALRETDR